MLWSCVFQEIDISVWQKAMATNCECRAYVCSFFHEGTNSRSNNWLNTQSDWWWEGTTVYRTWIWKVLLANNIRVTPPPLRFETDRLMYVHSVTFLRHQLWDTRMNYILGDSFIGPRVCGERVGHRRCGRKWFRLAEPVFPGPIRANWGVLHFAAQVCTGWTKSSIFADKLTGNSLFSARVEVARSPGGWFDTEWCDGSRRGRGKVWWSRDLGTSASGPPVHYKINTSMLQSPIIIIMHGLLRTTSSIIIIIIIIISLNLFCNQYGQYCNDWIVYKTMCI